jgi:two-component system, OmpR family, sensor histidine kinase KdpD
LGSRRHGSESYRADRKRPDCRYAEIVARSFGFLLTPEPPARRVGVLVALALVAFCTLLIYPLKQAAPVVSLGVVYMLAVVIVSVTWGVWLGVATSLVSALAFNYFHLPPVGELTLRNADNWVALVAFVVVSMLASSVAEVTRARSREAAERRREADLAAEMARLLLGGRRLSEDLPTAAARLSQVLELPSAAIELEAVEGDERRVAFPLREGPRRLGTLLVPADSSEATLRRLQERVVPALESLLSAALERESLLSDVVETAALRRADVVKTALLRAVSHDLRSPLTAISAAADALGSVSLSEQERREMATIIQQETHRLSRLVDNLLDLSRLEAGAAEPRAVWSSIEEVIRAALSDLTAQSDDFTLSIDRDLPLVSIDPVQMERAFVNVFENARRHCGGHPVSVRARAVRSLAGAQHASPAGSSEAGEPRASGIEAQPATVESGPTALQTLHGGSAGDRLVVRVVDRGPGIPPAQLERVFEPFYRAGTAQGGHRGSGLGLAIARGFTESNGGRLHVESLPGQGAAFVFELPLSPQPLDGAEGSASVSLTSPEHVL